MYEMPEALREAFMFLFFLGLLLFLSFDSHKTSSKHILEMADLESDFNCHSTIFIYR